MFAAVIYVIIEWFSIEPKVHGPVPRDADKPNTTRTEHLYADAKLGGTCSDRMTMLREPTTANTNFIENRSTHISVIFVALYFKGLWRKLLSLFFQFWV